jgi:hypothetical protein
VNDRGPGEIQITQLRQPAAAPNPLAENWIDDERDEEAIDEIGFEVGAFGHEAGSDGPCRRAESELKEKEGERGDGQAWIELRQITQEEPIHAEEVITRAEHQAKAGYDKCQRAHGRVHEILGHDIDDVLGADQSSLEKTKPGLHEEDQRGANEHPDGIDRTGNSFGFLGERRLRKDQHQSDDDHKIGRPAYHSYRSRSNCLHDSPPMKLDRMRRLCHLGK